jgi:hypothetical protein
MPTYHHHTWIISSCTLISSSFLNITTLQCKEKTTRRTQDSVQCAYLSLRISTSRIHRDVLPDVSSIFWVVLPESMHKRSVELANTTVNKDRERVLRTGEPSCRTRIVGRATRAGAVFLPPGRPQFAPSSPFVRYYFPIAFPPSGAALWDT